MSDKKYYDWDAASKNIDLRDYITYRFPNFYISQRHPVTSKSVELVDNDDPSLRTNKYGVFFKNGVWLYNSRYTDKGGDFVQFVKNEVARGRDWEKVINEELEKYYPVQYELREKNKHFPTPIPSNRIGVGFQLNGKLYSLFKGSLEYITEFRKLSLNTINSPVFKDVAKSYIAQGKKSYCIGIPLINTKEEMVGLNRIFTYKESTLFNEKRFLSTSDNTYGFSKSNTLKNTEKFILCEGIWDGMAHYELNQPKNVEYIFSNGELGKDKAIEILKYIEQRGVKNIEFANDNDLRGNIFDLLLLNLLIPNLKLKASSKEVLTISIIAGESVFSSKVEEMLNHFLSKNNDLVNTIKANNGNETMLSQNDLFIFNKKNESNEIEISLPNRKDYISDFNNFAIHMFSYPNEISISKAESKDFNDDLKTIKTANLKTDLEISVEKTTDNQNQINR
ncbi:hypothetical protein [Chryseobacterium sp. 5_R23647]|uniref:hypothetical protein n=1 Tax=Chryseobacterium sp. 5_R23647 TaxID=2258964 RepID=UPI000E254DA3|nr:hypothetical protein [Chryseobacterium sp. 5_R23647]REC40567.1 hypothetical protein DRF69_18330 [Chryseobacterium sp. 5_R23647]